jgi:hypothetical protein
MAREIIARVATTLYGAEDPAMEDLVRKIELKIPDDIEAHSAAAIAVTALLQMLAFPAPGSEEHIDERWFDES